MTIKFNKEKIAKVFILDGLNESRRHIFFSYEFLFVNCKINANKNIISSIIF